MFNIRLLVIMVGERRRQVSILRMWLGIIPAYFYAILVNRVTITPNTLRLKIQHFQHTNDKPIAQGKLPFQYTRQ